MGVARYGACLLVRVEGTIVRHCPPVLGGWVRRDAGHRNVYPRSGTTIFQI